MSILCQFGRRLTGRALLRRCRGHLWAVENQGQRRSRGTHRRPFLMAKYGVFIGFLAPFCRCYSLTDASFQAGIGSAIISEHGHDQLRGGDLFSVKVVTLTILSWILSLFVLCWPVRLPPLDGSATTPLEFGRPVTPLTRPSPNGRLLGCATAGMKLQALDDEDLRPLWDHISEA